nr:T9SS type A sorting domain-containing protein [uncultured Flavobacterium sp.]
MKALLIAGVTMLFSSLSAQTITFNGCHGLFENQTYTFNMEAPDVTGRNTFNTTPVDGAQTCGGLGTCEFKISWSVSNSRWEFIADSGNGDFVNPYLIYYNTAASTPNPPSLTLGTWVENIADTDSDCGGDLAAGNSTLTGAVQNTLLGTADFAINKGVVLYPNPASEVIMVESKSEIISFSIMNIQGQTVMNVDNDNRANVSVLQNGVYLLRLNTTDGVQVMNFIKK